MLSARTILLALALLCMASLGADAPRSAEQSLRPYAGPIAEGIEADTLRGKVMAGYQGWFMADGDGYGAGFVHWGDVAAEPPTCTVDMWPDLSEHEPDETYATRFRHADGSAARVFSSTDRRTVLRHFRWMRDYGIDGAFVQRFAVCIDPADEQGWNDRRTNAVLSHCREGANTFGRTFAVMYDCDFDRATCDRLMADWRRLVDRMRILDTPAYQRHAGAPVVALWGYGFDHRRFDAEAAEELFRFLKRPENGGCTIMLGVPNDWAGWTDARRDLIEKHVTLISPWNVGRYDSDASAAAHFARFWPGDLAWCKARGKDYYPVVFPGFSWHNLTRGRDRLNAIPRRGGRFLWAQFEQARAYGMDMAYVAMFDEVDEGTAIFKVSNGPPIGAFVTLEGLPSDFYLRLAGLGGRMLRGEDVAFPAP